MPSISRSGNARRNEAIYAWYDAPGRNFAEVEAVLETAIRNEKARLGTPLEVPAEELVPA
jgi:hypothetical protein